MNNALQWAVENPMQYFGWGIGIYLAIFAIILIFNGNPSVMLSHGKWSFGFTVLCIAAWWLMIVALVVVAVIAFVGDEVQFTQDHRSSEYED